MMMPPAICDSQPCLLTTRPTSCTATTCVQRTRPVSVSTTTSAIWTPPTPWLETPGLALASAAVQVPVALICVMPSRAQASFHDQLLLVALLTILPGSMSRSSGLESSFGAIALNNSSLAVVAARRAAGACDGQVVLPPEPLERPN